MPLTPAWRGGLSSAEAATLLAACGPNSLPERPPPSLAALLLRQLADPMIGLLAVAAALSLVLGDLLDAGVILAIVVLNGGLGALQEGRAERAARAVRGLLVDTTRVVRDGATTVVNVERLVPGDLVVVGQGDHVPADGQVVEAAELEVSEAVLTGESLPVPKHARVLPALPPAAPLTDRPCFLHAGTTVTRGQGRFVVTATAEATELGRISAAAEAIPRERTPLQRRLDRLTATLIRAALAACVVLAGAAWIGGESPGQSALIGIALAVAAVPEGLPAVVTVVLALGMRRLAAHGAIVRRLRAVETLGSATVICSDKTGTLTRNEMAVVRLYQAGGAERAMDGADPHAFTELLRAALIASEPDSLEPGDAAIAALARRAGLDRDAALGASRVVRVRPFDSRRRRTSTVVTGPASDLRSFVKGAPETLLERLAVAAPGLEERAARWSGEGLRVLLVAARERLGPGEDPERGLRPIGLVGLADPPRPEARASVEQAADAGVRTVMLTGDHRGTALAVARQLGIAEPGDEAVTGAELDRMDDAALDRALERTAVFARIAPEHKLRVVRALRRQGEVVAATGDGVNDVPALRAADIGVAMGRRGTDAAAAAADLVLTDDRYSTLVVATAEGRRIYDNVVRFVHFLLAANAGEILVFALAVLGGLGAPLTVVQLLLVNLLTDGPPALALGVDPPAPGLMARPPRPMDEPILRPGAAQLAVGGAATGLAAFAAFLLGSGQDGELARTMCFTTLACSQLAYVFSVRGPAPCWRGGRNPALLAGVAGSAAVAALVLTLPPLASAVDVVRMSALQLGVSLGLALVPLAAAELYKLLRRHRG